MNRYVVIFHLSMIFCGLALAVEDPNMSRFEGKELTIQIYRKPLEGGKSIQEEKTVVIKDGMFTLSEKELEVVSGISIIGRAQKDPLLKEQIGRSSHSYHPFEGPSFYLPFREKELDGREVLVRIYENWHEDPKGYELMSIKSQQRKVHFDFDDVNDFAFVAVFGQDQNDVVIQKVLGRRVCGWAYRKGMEYEMPVKVSNDKPEDFVVTFFDGLGDPVVEAEVEIYLEHDERLVWAGRIKLDENGIGVMPFCGGKGDVRLVVGMTRFGWDTRNFRFVLKHPDYGNSVVEMHVDNDDWKKSRQDFIIPAVPISSEISNRSIWGRVLDPDKRPVGGLFVKATGFYPPGGEYVSHVGGQHCGAITDRSGRFRIYIPPKENTLKTGWIVPLDSKYHVLIKPSRVLGLLPYKGKIPNGKETEIILERAEHFRTFVFEDENGPITGDRMRRIRIRIEREDKEGLFLKYDDFKSGGQFPSGTYKAWLSSGRDLRFEPLEVTSKSPRELVFRPAPEKVYYGIVLEGVTALPYEGAFVIDMSGSSSRNLSMLKDIHWENLRKHSSVTQSSSDPNIQEALREVDLCYSFSRIVRSDENGYYELILPAGQAFSKFVVFDQNSLTVILDNDDFARQSDGRYKVPQARLYPAAKVSLETFTEEPNDGRHPALWAQWIVSRENNPKWVSNFLADCRFDMFMDTIRNDFIVHLNENCVFPVPAGIKHDLQLRPLHGDKEKGWAPLTVDENLIFSKGEFVDLGQFKISRALTLFVQVVNLADKPVEGVPVICTSKYGNDTHHTDQDGLAEFLVAPDSRGEFTVEYKANKESGKPLIREAIPYEITRPEDANSLLTLQVSDELLGRLFE